MSPGFWAIFRTARVDFLSGFQAKLCVPYQSLNKLNNPKPFLLKRMLNYFNFSFFIFNLMKWEKN
jgi:hypothetical protein